MVNKPRYARKIIFGAFDEPNFQTFDKQRYKSNYCLKCISKKQHATAVDTVKKVKFQAPRPKTKKFKKVAIIKDLEKWQDCVWMLKFKSSQVI